MFYRLSQIFVLSRLVSEAISNVAGSKALPLFTFVVRSLHAMGFLPASYSFAVLTPNLHGWQSGELTPLVAVHRDPLNGQPAL